MKLGDDQDEVEMRYAKEPVTGYAQDPRGRVAGKKGKEQSPDRHGQGEAFQKSVAEEDNRKGGQELNKPG